jgi:hypothetical protein
VAAVSRLAGRPDNEKESLVTRTLPCIVLALSLALVGARASHALDADDLPNAIENAKTAADHVALAEYFETEAKSARTRAERHRKMSALYGNYPKPSGTKGNRASLGKSMPPHCDKLVADYEAAAAEYEAMAAAHRTMASELE